MKHIFDRLFYLCYVRAKHVYPKRVNPDGYISHATIMLSAIQLGPALIFIIPLLNLFFTKGTFFPKIILAVIALSVDYANGKYYRNNGRIDKIVEEYSHVYSGVPIGRIAIRPVLYVIASFGSCLLVLISAISLTRP